MKGMRFGLLRRALSILTYATSSLQVEMLLLSGDKVKFPGVYRRIKDNLSAFLGRMKQVDPSKLVADGNIGQDELEVRLREWAESVYQKSREGYDVTMDALSKLFGGGNGA